MITRQLQAICFTGAGALLLAAAIGCGSPNTAGKNTGEDPTADTSCADNSDCALPKTCVGGICKAPDTNVTTTPCGTDRDCSGAEYCHLPSTFPWVDGTEGVCANPCSGDDDCASLGQICSNGRCYTNIDCSPGNNSSDCPPGEVCSAAQHTCQAPPGTCYFNEQCPVDWVCNTDNSCIDPNNISFGGCSSPADCTSPECANSSCECNGGECQPIGGCSAASDCPAGNYCAAGMCRPAETCAGQDACTPYGLVCTSGYCVNPQPCDASGNCPAGFACYTNYNPPACMPQDAQECVRDDQCPSGQFCELFNGACMGGCRDNSDCSFECAAANPPAWCSCIDGQSCFCNSAHECNSNQGGSSGATCTSDAACGVGTACVSVGTIEELLMCSITGCATTCEPTCSFLMESVTPVCLSPKTCQNALPVGGSLGDIFSAGACR